MPETLVSYQANQLMQNTVRDMMRRGVDPRSPEFDWDALREMVSARAHEDLRASMLLDRVAEAEGLEVTDEEVEAEIDSMIEQSGRPAEQVRAALTKEGGERSIADRLRNRKALDFLVAHAAVSDEEWRDEEKPEEKDAEAAGAARERSPEA